MGFKEAVYEILSKTPKGKVTTYKAIAEALGTKAYRAVGNALNRNKDTVNISCYKVVSSDGILGGYSKGAEEKTRRLKEDGIEVENGKIKEFEKRLFNLLD